MDGFELNKIVAAFLIALLAAMVFSMIGDSIVAPMKRLTKNVLIVPVSEDSSKSESTKEKELAPITPLLAKANVENGERVFKKCVQCHSLEKSKHGIGPSLWGVIGRTIAALGDYAYSSALKEKSAHQWDAETINQFIYKPRTFASGTKMTFIGIDSDQERADVIAYLQKSGN